MLRLWHKLTNPVKFKGKDDTPPQLAQYMGERAAECAARDAILPFILCLLIVSDGVLLFILFNWVLAFDSLSLT